MAPLVLSRMERACSTSTHFPPLVAPSSLGRSRSSSTATVIPDFAFHRLIRPQPWPNQSPRRLHHRPPTQRTMISPQQTFRPNPVFQPRDWNAASTSPQPTSLPLCRICSPWCATTASMTMSPKIASGMAMSRITALALLASSHFRKRKMARILGPASFPS